ncbi:energy transducer TonB [Cryomorpha ignava]|uniref:Energy transducer TonB n=1 Tax=Cryomorpha ignava TaxID=101383 RepID=A0A7K3WW39_9FLAO|nr:energy transducer TonB [Cryomorpha ignava]NEN25142.1 energy transducer TonB [Cryomorpha ignava]
MIEKKNRDYRLERFRAPLFFLGLLFSSAFVLTAFEWKTYSDIPTIDKSDRANRDLPDEPIFIAVPMQKPLPPPPAPKPVIDELVLIDDDKKIDLILDIPNFEPEDEPVISVISAKAEVVTEEVIELPFVDEWPSFPGGDTARVKYLMANVNYPDKAKHVGVQGTVWVEFIIAKDGSIEDAVVIRGVGAGLDEEALRVVNEMPRWTPGKQRGLPVKVRFRLPIKYTLL